MLVLLVVEMSFLRLLLVVPGLVVIRVVLPLLWAMHMSIPTRVDVYREE